MVIQPIGQTSPGVLRVVEVDAQTDPRWPAFVAAHPNGLVYHHPAWLQVLEEMYGHKPVCLVCEDTDGQVRGVLPLMHTRGLLTGHRLSSLPRTPVAGPLALDPHATSKLIQTALALARAERGTQLQLRMPSAELEGLVDGMAGVPWEAMYVLELPARPEELRFGNSRNHGRIRWAVNKAAKLQVQVQQAESEDELRAWYDLYLETMRWHAAPPLPYRFFEVCWAVLRPHGLLRLLLAEQHEAGQRKLLAGSIFLMFGQTVVYAFNGRCQEDLALRPNDAIQWRAIHDAYSQGFRRFDFGEVAEHNQGLAEFKSKWGAEPRWLYKYHYPAVRSPEPGTHKSDSYIRQLANAAWRRLPLKATALLGDLIYSYL